MHPTTRKLIAILLLIVGVEFWLTIGHGLLGLGIHALPILISVIVALVPPVNRLIDRALQKIRNPRPRTRAISSCCIALVATAYLLLTGFHQHKQFTPKLHDEFMQVLQMQMLARGHLWYPQHDLADFFESF